MDPRTTSTFQEGDENRVWFYGSVIDVVPETGDYTVKTDDGAVHRGIGSFLEDLLEPGETVAVGRGLGRPYILAKANLTVNTDGTPSYLVGETPAMSLRRGPADYSRSGDFRDRLPGDRILKTKEGNRVSALKGGLSEVYSSARAFIRTFQYPEDLLMLVGEHLYQETSMGYLDVRNVNGRNQLKWRGGLDQLTETGSGAEKYTLRLDIGDQVGLFRFAYTTPDGRSIASFEITPTGKVRIMGAGGIEQIAGNNGTSLQVVTGNSDAQYGGTRKERYGKDVVQNYQGSRATTVASGQATTYGFESKVINADQRTNVGSRKVTLVSGGADLTSPAYSLDVIDGDAVITVGNPSLGVTPALPKRKLSLQNLATLGNIELVSASGKVVANATTVVLGGDENSVQTSAVVYEQLNAKLSAWANEMNAKLASLIPSAAATSQGGVVWTPVNLDISASKSNNVKLR